MVGSESMDGPPKQFGVTKPISLAGPSEADLIRTKELEKFLEHAGLHESVDESAKRQEVLARIKQVFLFIPISEEGLYCLCI